jgi:acrylyl-CoA reductase (NADPH)
MAGRVIASDDTAFRVGDAVLAHGYDIGMSHHGGYSEVARVPAGWVVRLPAGLSDRAAMAIGTAGFTAAMSVDRLERDGVTPDRGPIVVTGASGGLGSWAIAILAHRGYQVIASTRRPDDAGEYLRGLGAADVIAAAETSAPSERPLEHARWAGAVDAVGGSTLAYLLRTMMQRGVITAAGNTGGATLDTTVFPFILRGVSVHGMDSAATPIGVRRALWARIATDLRPAGLDDAISRDVSLEELPAALAAMHAGASRGHVVVRMADGRGQEA